ncbi:fumarylacetoacetate hydrolase family protein [Syntrophus buswellii]|jgi:2-keto-4-pentenoate hydratase/2-oxohepta-3-ene-1,7-dioic acid hydratase in catechol pathway|uniref:fumarylacetoacetate hydrolase family protein n=1 Tax=Syntrophus buswellii TaxID=43774 RepID=UPI0009D2063F|nr:MAG: Ureidoglycolate lyase [Syntrophus sp. PtaB.Bin138]
MKIVRFISDSHRTLYGQYDPQRPAEARVIEGDLFGDFRVTSERVNIRQYLPPVTPVNILALGLNYRRHAEETRLDTPKYPILFMKASSSVIGHGEPILLPAAAPESVDYEAELAVVIGSKAKNLQPSEAMDCILGYTCANDVSARDWQLRRQQGQWVRAKSFDTFCPLGPWLVTKDEIPDPDRLRIRALLNERDILQDAATSEMIFKIPVVISFLSQSMTLLPGTVILTGTPEGVGFTRKPPLYLREGNRISVEIDQIGRLSNPVARERMPQR